MSNTQRLLALRSSPEQGVALRRIRWTAVRKSWGLIAITTILLLGVLGLNVFSGISLTQERVQRSAAGWVSRLQRLFEAGEELQKTEWASLEQEVLDSLRPTYRPLGLEPLVKRDVQDWFTLARSWQLALQPLSDYNAGPTGVSRATISRSLFTNDLAAVLDQAQALLPKTRKLWQSQWYYHLVGRLHPRISQVIDLIEEAFNLFDKILSYRQQILGILGHFSTQRLVLFNQNVGEARPTGGFLGSYLPMDVSKGQLQIGQSQSIYYVDNAKPDPLMTHPANWYYDLRRDILYEHGLKNLNYFSCFPTTAGLLEQEFSRSPNGYTMNGVIFITPQFIQRLLPENFSLSVPGVGSLNSSNFLAEIERLTAIETFQAENPKADLTPVFQALLGQLPRIISSQGLPSLVASIVNSLLSRDLQVWFLDSKLQELWQSLGLAGDSTCDSSKLFMAPMIANLSGDKRNLVTDNHFNIYTKSVPGGVRVRVRYKQTIPENPALQRPFNQTESLTFVGLDIPPQAFDLQVDSPQMLRLPFLRDYADVMVRDMYPGKTPRYPEEISKIVNSGQNLPKGGFVYTQPSGQRSLGLYIEDDQVSTVDFAFTIPVVPGYTQILFYGQPGLNNPNLGLGRGVRYAPNPKIRQFADGLIIQKGLPLQI